MPANEPESLYLALRVLLVDARKAAGLSQVELAKQLGKHQSYISKVETGERKLDVIEFLTLIRAIGADPAEIISKLEPPAFEISNRAASPR